MILHDIHEKVLSDQVCTGGVVVQTMLFHFLVQPVYLAMYILHLESLGHPCSCISSRGGLIPAASNPVLLRPIQIQARLNAL